ncbi:hypothetical protein [Kordia sp.]|uniref:hypothetical protein n=1 Tax=Kordia sp. TaxID=1965332 RepID=UPI003D2DC678
MTKKEDTTQENDTTVSDVDKVFAISGIALSGLALLFYPVEEIADSTETELGFVGTVSKVISGLGLIGTLWSMGLLYTEETEDMPPALKWVLIPLLVLDVFLILLLIGMRALNTTSVGTVGSFVLKFIKPVICTLGAVGLIVGMAVMPKKLLKMSFIGMAIHYLPAALGYAPINKQPFYVLVVFVRTGGLITALAGDIIDVATEEKPKLEA